MCDEKSKNLKQNKTKKNVHSIPAEQKKKKERKTSTDHELKVGQAFNPAHDFFKLCASSDM